MDDTTKRAVQMTQSQEVSGSASVRIERNGLTDELPIAINDNTTISQQDDAVKQEKSCTLNESEGMTQQTLMEAEPRIQQQQNAFLSSDNIDTSSSNCATVEHVEPAAQNHHHHHHPGSVINCDGNDSNCHFDVDQNYCSTPSTATASKQGCPKNVRTSITDKAAEDGVMNNPEVVITSSSVTVSSNAPDGESSIADQHHRAKNNDSNAALSIKYETDGTSIIQEPTSNYGYRDFSRISLSDIANDLNETYQKQAGTIKGKFFPSKLYDILSRPEFAQIVSWSPHGRAWRVMKPLAFKQKVLPRYFRHSNHSSFMRQVNGWGFRRITRGRDMNSYFHELFLRGLPHLLNRMTRMALPDLQPRDEPDLYKVSESFPLPKQLPACADVIASNKNSANFIHPINNDTRCANSAFSDQEVVRSHPIGDNLCSAQLVNQQSAALQHLGLNQQQIQRQQYPHNYGLWNAAGLGLPLYPGSCIGEYPAIDSSRRESLMGNSVLQLEQEPSTLSQNFGDNATNIVEYSQQLHRNTVCLQQLRTAGNFLNPPATNLARVPLPAAIPKLKDRKNNISTSKNFPSKLHDILSREDLQSYIAWSPSGKEWRVLKPNTFAKDVIPQYFQHDQYNSFMRQVNAWGFKRINNGPTANYYTHELFARDRPDLCQQMRRQRNSLQGKLSGVDQRQISLSNDNSFDNEYKRKQSRSSMVDQDVRCSHRKSSV
mmetsp:Transcript_11072/g.16618  ORF Transcript_11072/g.16618 Transcript_11072/m.16618 type:complete len:714 (-) Transcript_11072:226-2367(-)|eukprot:CAMPEP_0196819704 /NCGR_PEP_ID=MMETSP1362-20130617/71808_1 /TAXON_ID=163516 /ORGANISM="Leptocylindrus danicus, Strain CCMP1856" /LENGTH=713 /DNA_ID=CAMNT_0042198285 /DNA_START=110 /DNA_END=2251 /DNA_ORIENTATION=-